jgi:hypothetical protein
MRPRRRRLSPAGWALASTLALAVSAPAAELKFERIVIDNDFPAAYQVEVADVDGDGKPDVVAVGGATCAWYQNPTWKKRIVTGPKQTPGIISSATRDIDGDGKAEIAIGYDFEMNEPARGKLLLARQGKTVDDPWTVELADAVPSVHRLRWATKILGGRVRTDRGEIKLGPFLVAAPIFGPMAGPPRYDQQPARIELFSVVALDLAALRSMGVTVSHTPPIRSPLNELRPVGGAPVTHAIDVVDFHGDGRDEVLGASNLGVTLYSCIGLQGLPAFAPRLLVPGAPGDAPKKGASEIHVGRLKDGRRFLATVEPWHGTDVAVYLAEKSNPDKFGPRTVLDTSLKDGHALWVADVDGDGDDEVFAGFRGPGTSVLMYDFNGTTWDRTVVDDQIAAQDLRGGDLDGDGTPDVVAVGGSTHNVVWYRPVRRAR